ncbi:hypothetical protein ACJZ2D_002673 [Fusarium nematophilum]
MDLPQLDLQEAPIRHQNCCLSLSSKLLQILSQVFYSTPPRQTPTVLSIGSGSGLLEALLLAHVQSQHQTCGEDGPGLPRFNVVGVEVQQSVGKEPVNKYLPEQAIYAVRGTWNVVSRLQETDVTGLMFVYPRQPTLVSEYTKAISEQGLQVEVIVWLGPMADWGVFEPCFGPNNENKEALFSIDEMRQGVEAGLDEYELMVVLRRSTQTAEKAPK